METLVIEKTEEVATARAVDQDAALIVLTVEQLCDVGGGTTYVLY